MNSDKGDVKILRVTDLTEIQVNGVDEPEGGTSKIHAGMRVDATLGMDPDAAGRVVATNSR